MPPYKRRKLSSGEVQQTSSNSEDDQPIFFEERREENLSESEDSRHSSPVTEDEIEGLKRQKSKQTSKRKIRATGTATFGATLQSLLQTEAPSTLPLSLKPSIARKHNDEKLELKAKKVLQVEKKEKEDKGRIKDVIGGWGGESERGLRKVAQRGVVKLFNAIQQSQATVAAAGDNAKAGRGSGKPTLPAPILAGTGKKNKDNIIGRGKESVVDKDDFFNMIKSGGVVSKA